MAQIYDISKKITNELPTLKITDDIIVTINNRHTNILNIQAMALADEKKPDNEKMTEDEMINESMKLLIGESNHKKIKELDLPIPEFRSIYAAMLEIATTGALSGDTPK